MCQIKQVQSQLRNVLLFLSVSLGSWLLHYIQSEIPTRLNFFNSWKKATFTVTCSPVPGSLANDLNVNLTWSSRMKLTQSISFNKCSKFWYVPNNQWGQSRKEKHALKRRKIDQDSHSEARTNMIIVFSKWISSCCVKDTMYMPLAM